MKPYIIFLKHNIDWGTNKAKFNKNDKELIDKESLLALKSFVLAIADEIKTKKIVLENNQTQRLSLDLNIDEKHIDEVIIKLRSIDVVDIIDPIYRGVTWEDIRKTR